MINALKFFGKIVQLQVLQVADHQGVVLLLGSLDDLVGTEPEIVLGVAHVCLPVLVTDVLHTSAELLFVADTEQVIVVCTDTGTGQ